MNFRDLDELIHSGEKNIVLNSDIVLDEDEASSYLDGIALDVDGIIIDGGTHSIDACGQARIFCCTAKGVTIRNVSLKGGLSKGNGGAIHNLGELDVSGCEFASNEANGDGAAIYNGRRLNIAESIFTKNTANGSGGAIRNVEGSVKIKGSVLSENESKNSGGAISNALVGTVVIEKSELNRNLSQKSGGAINNIGTLHISDSQLNENAAKGEGSGAIYNFMGGDLFITNSVLNRNTSRNGKAISSYDENRCRIKDCEMQGNAVDENLEPLVYVSTRNFY